MLRSFISLIVLTFWGLTASAQTSYPVASSKKIALTFDACMTRGMFSQVENGTYKSLISSAVIKYLQQEKISATLFITGLWAEKYPAIMREISSDSLFEIGNHSYSHRGFLEKCYTLPSLPAKEKEGDILKSQDVLTKFTGKKPQLFRFPGGCYSLSDIALVKKLGLKVVGWTFPSGDAFNNNTQSIVQNVLSRARPGAIIVFHITEGRYAPKTAEALRLIIPALRKQGYQFSKVSFLMKEK